MPVPLPEIHGELIHSKLKLYMYIPQCGLVTKVICSLCFLHCHLEPPAGREYNSSKEEGDFCHTMFGWLL